MQNENLDGFITREELLRIQELKQKLQLLELQKHATELELKNEILQIYIRYRLTERDSIEELTGKIIKVEQ